MDELREAKRRKCEDEDGGKQYYKSKSMYDIINALLDKNLSLSDIIHGLFKLFPPELLHTSGSGLIMYMFESLQHQIGLEVGKTENLLINYTLIYQTLLGGKVNGISQEDP